MVAAVSNAGGLGSIGSVNLDAAAARAMIRRIRELTARPFNVDVFCPQRPTSDKLKEAAWLQRLSPFVCTIPLYPIAYGAAKALHVAASKKGELQYAVQWAGQGVPQARARPAGELVAQLVEEMETALYGRVPAN